MLNITHTKIQASYLYAHLLFSRSVTPFSISSPHTGWQDYDANVKKIPTASITVEDAEMLSRMYKRGAQIAKLKRRFAKNYSLIFF